MLCTRKEFHLFDLQLVGICRNQLEEWSSVDGPVDLAARGKDLSFEFSTQLLVSNGATCGGAGG
jgi:hypothetical protein